MHKELAQELHGGSVHDVCIWETTLLNRSAMQDKEAWLDRDGFACTTAVRPPARGGCVPGELVWRALMWEPLADSSLKEKASDS